VESYWDTARRLAGTELRTASRLKPFRIVEVDDESLIVEYGEQGGRRNYPREKVEAGCAVCEAAGNFSTATLAGAGITERDGSEMTYLPRVIERIVQARRQGAEQRRYPEPKERELDDDEKDRIRDRIKQGEGDIYELAREFGCSSSQVAGIKAAMSR
jgi:hypothetical protein